VRPITFAFRALHFGRYGAEVRIPLLGNEQFGLVEAPYVPTELAVFVDGGAAWNADESPELRFSRDALGRVPVFSAGLALRTVLGGVLPIELHYTVPFQRPDGNATFGFGIAPGW
jgi:outer membrane protein assembly factor BamA